MCENMPEEERYSEDETQRRFEAALRAALRTPHKPMKALPRKRGRKPEREPVSKKPAKGKPAG